MAWFDDLNTRAQQQVGAGGINHDYSAYEQFLNAQQPKKQEKGNFLTSLIPTAGGTGGALGGAALGTALLPGIGTLAGGIIGGALGSVAGKYGENIIEEQDDPTQGLVQEGLLGAVTSTPVGAGLKIARAGLKAGTGIGKTAAGDLIQSAAAQTAGKGTAERFGLSVAPSNTASKAGVALENKANQMLASQSQLTASQARSMGINPVGTFGRINQRTGLTNLDDMASVSRGLTGGQDSLLDTLTRAAVDEAPGVAVGNLRKTASDLIDNSGSLLSDSQRKNILRNVKNASTTMFGGSKGSIDTLANPGAALDQANAFRSTARDLTSTFSASPADKQLGKIYNNLANELEKSIYSAPGVSQSIPTLVKAGRDDLLYKADELAAAGSTSQANAYRKIAGELENVKSVKDLRSMKRDFVDIGKIDNATAQADSTRTLGGRDLSNTAGSLLRNPANLLAGPLDAATPSIAGQAANLGRKLQSTTATAGQGVVPLALRQGTGRLLVGGTDTVDPTNSANPLDQSALPGSALGGLQAQTQDTQQVSQPSNPFGVSLDDVASQLKVALQNGDTKGYSTLSDLYDRVYQYEKATGTGELGATAKNSLASSANGINTLDQLESIFQQTGGGSGRIGGAIQNVLGSAGLDNNASLYNDLSASTVTQLAKALNGGGQVTDADARVVIQALPRITDNSDVAAAKFAALRQRLQIAAQNTAQFGGGSTDLSSILAQYQNGV